MEEENIVTPRPKVVIIAAVGRNRELGKDNELLWHLGEDMRFFKEQTVRHFVIMGRKSYESIPKKYRPLPDRVNIIISRDSEYLAEECYTFTNLKDALDLAHENGEEKVFIIGGGEIYKKALDEGLVDEMYLTHVQAEFADAQVFFPAFEHLAWNKQHVKSLLADSLNEFAFDIFHYVKPESTAVPTPSEQAP